MKLGITGRQLWIRRINSLVELDVMKSYHTPSIYLYIKYLLRTYIMRDSIFPVTKGTWLKLKDHLSGILLSLHTSPLVTSGGSSPLRFHVQSTLSHRNNTTKGSISEKAKTFWRNLRAHHQLSDSRALEGGESRPVLTELQLPSQEGEEEINEHEGRHISKTKPAMLIGTQRWSPVDYLTYNFSNCHIFKTALWEGHINGWRVFVAF